MAGQIIEGQEDFPIRRADFNRTEAAEAGRLTRARTSSSPDPPFSPREFSPPSLLFCPCH